MNRLPRSYSLWFWLFTFCLFPLGSTGQLNTGSGLTYPKRILTPRNGLPQSFVSGLVQDKQGFVWVGTRNGLARFDGKVFKVFQHNKLDSTTLSSNVIAYLTPDAQNRIWIQFESTALDVFDPVTEQITHVSQDPLFQKNPKYFVSQGLLIDHEGKIWGIERENGLYCYDLKGQKLTHYTQQTHGLPSNIVRGLLEDRQHRIWVITMAGLARLEKGRFQSIPTPFPLEFGSSRSLSTDIISMIERPNGEVMFSDARKLIFYHPEKHSFRYVSLPHDENLSIRWIRRGLDQKEYWELNGKVYQYTDPQGIRQIAETLLPTMKEACSFLVDRSGLIWLGTNAAGLHQIDLTTPYFQIFENTSSFHEDLFQKEFGISLGKTFGWPPQHPEYQLSSYNVRSAYDGQHRLWVGLWKNLGYWDAASRRFILLPLPPELLSNQYLYQGIRGLAFDAQGQVWISGQDGYVASFNEATRQWTTQSPASAFAQAVQKKNVRPVIPVDLLVDEKAIYLTTEFDGLVIIDRATHQIQTLTHENAPKVIPTNQLIGLAADPTRKDIFWIGSYDGLICFHKSSRTSETFSLDQGLPDNSIYSMLPDAQGSLWLATNKGLCQFHPVTHQIRLFQAPDGLPGEEFNRFHYLRLPDDRLAFGGIEGWTLFKPTGSFTDAYRPTVGLTQVLINNTPIDQTPFKQPLAALHTLELPYDQNSLVFNFAGLQYSQPQKLTYRYQLEGYDEDWNHIGTASEAHYTKLPPGHYTLRVNVTNTSGQWSPHIYSLSLVIRPPFYQSWWAYALYVVLAGTLVWLFVQYRIRQDRFAQAMVLKEKEAQQLRWIDELKTKFFSNITHEFRTPLTLILTPTERLKQEIELPHQQRWLAAIERNAHQLLRLINQLMDLSKLESGMMKLSLVRGNVEEVLTRLVQSFQIEAEQKGVQLSFNCSSILGEYWFDVDKFERIAYNLLSNAIKFSQSGDQVQVSLGSQPPVHYTRTETDPGIYLTIADTALGISPEALPHIFDRFYQVDESHFRQGTGIGLALVKELVELQLGFIEVISEQNRGTSFVVFLPYTGAEQALPETPNVETDSSEILPETKAHLLLVEDNVELAEFIIDSLPSSYRVSLASNGAEGYDRALSLCPDLIISDIMMPVMDGLAMCQAIRNDEQVSHIPIILLTAKAAYESRIEGLSRGANAYITKPFHVEELNLEIRNLLEQQKLSQQHVRQSLIQDTPVQKSIEDPFLTRCYTLLEERLDDSSLSVETFASLVNMSRVNLHRKIKALTGLSVSEVIRNYRLKRATAFLEQGLNTSQTAYQVGFENPSYFIKCFRDLYHMTPSEYVKKVNAM
ncbi:hybrid sensor histidine kinase/response regulator transcription factor [Siphonobacter sp.]|uniref:hybrid sensor histidine kinase/response regulator transcription factor n=1 Tax=Siphonobacter sp. TaxID=1869184 RepID=UPI003B3BAB67